MWQAIAGRVISGFGAAGMVVIVSVLLTGKIDISSRATRLEADHLAKT